MKKYKDHLGQEFPSQSALCRHYNILPNVLNNRLRWGWSLERALTEPVHCAGSEGKVCKDYLGNSFKTIKDMCKHYGVSYISYYTRLKKGYGLKTALTK